MKKQHLLLFALIAVFCANTNLNAQTPFNPNAYSGWISTPGNYFANLPVAPGVTFTQPVRGAGNQFSTAPDGINSGQWNNVSAAAAIAANRYFSFSAKADATTTFSIDSISLILERSSTGPDSCILQYKSPATGYNFVPFTSGVFVVSNPAVNLTTTLLLTPAASITIPSGDSIVFRLTAWHASGSLGKLKIVNNTRLFGKNFVAHSITAPLVQTSEAVCVSPIKGDSVQVTFTTTGSFNTGNAYSLELSDASGNFSSPVVLGTISSTANTGTINGFIPAGTLGADYRLRIQSSNPIISGMDTTHLTVNPGIVLNASVLQPACTDSLGAINLTASGGTGTMQYTWSNGSNTEDVIGLPEGTIINVHATDAAGCSIDSSFQMTTIPAFNVTETISHVLCHSAENGEISVLITGGTAPYTASWSGNGITETGLTAVDLPAGDYDVTVLDANNCEYTTTYTVTEPSAVNVSAVIAHAVCATCTGTVTITPTGGVAPYSFLWENNVTATTITGIPGEYCVTISDANACETDTCFTISSTAGVEDNAVHSFTRVFPNPASEAFYVSFSSALNGVKKEIRIVNLAGQTVFQSTLDSDVQTIDVTNWAPGSYIYQVQTESNQFESGKINVIN